MDARPGPHVLVVSVTRHSQLFGRSVKENAGAADGFAGAEAGDASSEAASDEYPSTLSPGISHPHDTSSLLPATLPEGRVTRIRSTGAS